MITKIRLSYQPDVALWQLTICHSGRTFLAPTRDEVIDKCFSFIPDGRAIKITWGKA